MEKETLRIEAFSDGVFAIAITLLAFNLHLPTTNDIHSNASLIHFLSAQWPSYLGITISFFSIFVMWVNHHKIFKQIYKRNNAVMFANGLILFFVTLISYPTALLSAYFNGDTASISVAIYTGMFVLINLSYNLLWYTATRHKNMLRPGLSDAAILKMRNNNLYGLPGYTAAFVLSFYYPTAALAICALLWIFWAASSGKIKFDAEG